uniref:Lysozyme g n=1 Tax=Periophthalmus magnuspinnatus TaxID=409849 RepID=A0A3B3ZP75_9GOBI
VFFLFYKDISIIKDAKGASLTTANQDNLGYEGKDASRQLAMTDLERMRTYKNMITVVGQELGIDPALIAGIISRESRAGNALQNGWGDHGRAWGLMQVDVTPNGGGHTRVGDWDSVEHVRQATGILIYFIGRIRGKFPTWTEAQHLKGAIAAYNMGDGNVKSYEEVDKYTTGQDYSNDVVIRAQWFKENLFC